jgi:hypothetical protein
MTAQKQPQMMLFDNSVVAVSAFIRRCRVCVHLRSAVAFGGTAMPTPRQLPRLFALARNAGLDNAALHDVVERRYGLTSLKALMPRQYEELTAALTRAADGGPMPTTPTPAETAELAPLSDGKWVGTLGAARTAVRTIIEDGLLWPAIEEDDIELAARLFEAFRLHRRSFRRISLDQCRKISLEWLNYDIALWRCAATRYLDGYTSRGHETYFEGVLRGVARERTTLNI